MMMKTGKASIPLWRQHLAPAAWRRQQDGSEAATATEGARIHRIRDEQGHQQVDGVLAGGADLLPSSPSATAESGRKRRSKSRRKRKRRRKKSGERKRKSKRKKRMNSRRERESRRKRRGRGRGRGRAGSRGGGGRGGSKAIKG